MLLQDREQRQIDKVTETGEKSNRAEEIGTIDDASNENELTWSEQTDRGDHDSYENGLTWSEQIDREDIDSYENGLTWSEQMDREDIDSYQNGLSWAEQMETAAGRTMNHRNSKVDKPGQSKWTERTLNHMKMD